MSASCAVCSQVVHIFSHIHQTYVVYSVCVKEADAQAENTQWLSRGALQDAAVSTGLKKVCVFWVCESLLCNEGFQHQEQESTSLSLTESVLLQWQSTRPDMLCMW